MKNAYRLYLRNNGTYYLEDAKTRVQRSLGTKNRQEARKLLQAENESANHPKLNFALSRVLLTHSEPSLLKRTWREAMAELASHGKLQSRSRCEREFKSTAYDLIRDKSIGLTTAEEFRLVLKRGKAAVSNYLRRLQNLAIDNGWIDSPILSPKRWEKVPKGKKRAITKDEHLKILAAEGNQERRYPIVVRRLVSGVT